MLSELMKESNWVAPENTYVIKHEGVDYDQYWSDEKHKFGPLLEATTYATMPEDVVRGGAVVDYRKVVGLK